MQAKTDKLVELYALIGFLEVLKRVSEQRTTTADIVAEEVVGVDKTAGEYDEEPAYTRLDDLLNEGAMAPLPLTYVRGIVSSCVVRYRREQAPYISIDIEWDVPQPPGTWPELPRTMHDDEWESSIAIGTPVTFIIGEN